MVFVEQLAGYFENFVSSIIGPKTVGSKPIKVPCTKQAVINAVKTAAWERAGGVPLVARVLFHISRAGVAEVILLTTARRNTEELKPWLGSMYLRQVIVDAPQDNIPSLISSLPYLESPFLYVDASNLIDPRILGGLVTASETTLAFIDRGDRERSSVRAGLIDSQGARIWAAGGNSALARHALSLFPTDVNGENVEIRGTTNPYFLEVCSRQDADRATDTLIRSNQNQVMDLPAQYIDPYFENALTSYLCDKPVTPNMVTFAGLAVAILVASLFWHGYFVIGAFLAFVVEILDGVDGKLARTKLIYSKLGQHEDVIDYFYETSWYVSLGVGLSSVYPGSWPALLAALLIVSDTMDNVLYTLAAKWHGKSIDLFSPLDGAFRRIAGRRNIYTAMFIVGFSMDYPMQTFAVAAIWAALTALIHGFRLVQYGKLQNLTAHM